MSKFGPYLRRNTAGLSCLAGMVLALGSAPLAAQSGGAVAPKPLVQPMARPEVVRLNNALRRLARNSGDLDALIDAGNSALQLNDLGAAIGFFGRADELSPGNARVKAGLAGALVRSERPVEALRLFAEAERAGASRASMASDRGLAYDLVGDPVSAQVQYALAMAASPDDELVRRLALSQAISGDRAGFEKALYPLLQARDIAAYRTRSFGLAILGDKDEAAKIAKVMMSPDLAARMTPYLRYMPRLTKAQQAAAANLGAFPRAAQIGRDDPRIAQYLRSEKAAGHGAAPSRRADAVLEPAGQALGPRKEVDAKSKRRNPDRRGDRGTGRAVQSPENAPAVGQRAQAGKPASSRPPLAKSAAPTRWSLADIVQRQQPPTGSAGQSVSRIVPKDSAQDGQLDAGQKAGHNVGKSAQLPADVRPGFDLAQLGRPSPDQPAAGQPAPNGSGRRASQPASVNPASVNPAAVKPASVKDAFAGFAPVSGPQKTSGAVDITAIKPPREVAQEPAAKPPVKQAPKIPSRHWVQIATGRDRKALAFDWRRISRTAPAILGKTKPHVVKWGRANRLLAGPYPSRMAAKAAISALKKAGIDSFAFTSPEGQAIDTLPQL